MFNRRLLVSTSGGGSDPVPELPDQDTLLLDGFGPGTVTIKIPEGCNVVKVFYDVYQEQEGFVQIDVQSVKTGVWWLEAYGYEGIGGDIYIGVTSGGRIHPVSYDEQRIKHGKRFYQYLLLKVHKY